MPSVQYDGDDDHGHNDYCDCPAYPVDIQCRPSFPYQTLILKNTLFIAILSIKSKKATRSNRLLIKIFSQRTHRSKSGTTVMKKFFFRNPTNLSR